MNFPLYIYYELLVRLSSIDPELGTYLSASENENTCILRTTNGTLTIATDILTRQFEQPESISAEELVELVLRFKPNYL